MRFRITNWRFIGIVIVALLLVLTILIIEIRQRGGDFLPGRPQLTNDDQKTSPTTDVSPVIPTSSASARAYIDRASEAARKDNYREAVRILEEGLQRFPDDQNLKLTKEYYENEAERRGQ